MLEKLREGLQASLRKLIGRPSIDEQAVKEFMKDLQRTLLQADVNVRLVLDLTSRIQKRALEENPPAGLSRKDHIVSILYEELKSIMGKESKLSLTDGKLNVLLLMGIQGSGKTTVTAKLSRYLQKRGHKVGVVCSDTFRPGAFTQLKMLCDPIGIPLYGDEKSKDSAHVASEGVKFFRNQGMNLIIVDTAGRHKEEKGLLEEMQDISKKIYPDLTLLVVDGTIGQACYAQAEAFHKTVPVGGIIITKLDGAAKGGGALAAAAATGAQILFISAGERVDDLEVFSPTRFVGRLLGMGDIKALIEKAKDLEIEGDEKKVQRIVSGKMTIDDLYFQLEQVKKMGSLRKIMDLIPGFSTGLPTNNLEGIEEKMGRWKSIIQSMNKMEKENPEILNSSRVRRIARGSGTAEKDVKEMLAKYRQAKAVMKVSKGRQFRSMLKIMQKRGLDE